MTATNFKTYSELAVTPGTSIRGAHLSLGMKLKYLSVVKDNNPIYTVELNKFQRFLHRFRYNRRALALYWIQNQAILDLILGDLRKLSAHFLLLENTNFNTGYSDFQRLYDIETKFRCLYVKTYCYFEEMNYKVLTSSVDLMHVYVTEFYELCNDYYRKIYHESIEHV